MSGAGASGFNGARVHGKRVVLIRLWWVNRVGRQDVSEVDSLAEILSPLMGGPAWESCQILSMISRHGHESQRFFAIGL